MEKEFGNGRTNITFRNDEVQSAGPEQPRSYSPMPMAGRGTYTPMPTESREEREKDKMHEQQLYFDNAKTVRSQAAMIEGLLKKISKLQRKEIMNETE